MVQLYGRALVRAGHEVRVAGIYRGDYPAPDFQDDEGVKVWRIRQPQKKFGWISSRYELYRLIQKWARNGDVELVEAPDSRGWFAAWPQLPIPLVQRSNGSYSYFAHDLGKSVDRLTYWLEKLSYSRSDSWTAVSQYTATETRGVFGLRSSASEILYNPIELDAQPSEIESRSKNKVTFTGTLVPKKGIVSLIDAWPAVKAACPKAELHVFGKDGKSSSGEPMIQYLLRERLPESLHGSVHFHGHCSRETLLASLSEARAAVFPSYSEAFAFAPLEAMSVACPTIYSTRGSGPELIKDKEEGLLVDPDQPNEISAAIVSILQDEVLASKLSDGGLMRSREFTLEALLPANEAFYHETIKGFERAINCPL